MLFYSYSYVDWSQHEPESGVFNFNDNLDIVEFLTLVNNTGLNAILRPGPYIDAERDFVSEIKLMIIEVYEQLQII